MDASAWVHLCISLTAHLFKLDLNVRIIVWFPLNPPSKENGVGLEMCHINDYDEMKLTR